MKITFATKQDSKETEVMKLTYTFHKEFTVEVSVKDLRGTYNTYRELYPHWSDTEILKTICVNYLTYNTIELITADLDLTRDQFVELAKKELGL